jgi:hypothetical protein
MLEFLQSIDQLEFLTLKDTGGRGRTDTPKEHDFESCASANSATPANRWQG